MAGIKIQKNYVSSNVTPVNVANNWMVLVYGITERGTTNPTIVQNYSTFLDLFGNSVSNTPTHKYVKFLLDNGVPVLFKRIFDKESESNAVALITSPSLTKTAIGARPLFSVTANEKYSGESGNNISVVISVNAITNIATLSVLYKSQVVETFNLGQAVPETENTEKVTNIKRETTNEEEKQPVEHIFYDIGQLLYTFIDKATKNTTNVSNFVDFALIEATSPWSFKISKDDNTQQYDLSKGSSTIPSVEDAIGMLADESNFVYQDVKILHAMTYYPQLRFATTGGIISDDFDTQCKILINLGKLSTLCTSTFRVLVDFSLDTIDVNKIRSFASNAGTVSNGMVSSSIFAYFGYWGADSNNNYLPGSAGFLTALARSGYNVYNRRIAGTRFSPAFVKPYKEIYIDALNDWQNENLIQLNPIVTIDAQDNLAIMGSSTLAMPSGSLSARNPVQALDIVCVSDYVAAILHNIALDELEAALDRLSLSSLSNRMSIQVQRFVDSGAITKFELNFDVTQLGKLGIECILYFAIGLEEVSITVTSVYDTDIINQ